MMFTGLTVFGFFAVYGRRKNSAALIAAA